MATFNMDVNFSESRAVQINVIGWVFTGTAIATVFLKLFARAQIVKRFDWDDFFIFFSLGLSIIAAALVSYSVTRGLGRHTVAVLAEHGEARLVETAMWQALGYSFSIGSFSFPNISIAILVNNLINPNPLRRNLLFGMVILQVVFALVSIFLIFLQCSPTQALWHPSIKGKCWDPSIFNGFSYWVSAHTTMTDIILAIVPIKVFWNLQMRFSTRLGLCIMMGLTLLSAVVTVIKATYLHLFTDRTDPLYNVVPLVLWGLIEQNVVIIAACIPTLRPFFHKAFGSESSFSSTGLSATHLGPGFKHASLPTNNGVMRFNSESDIQFDEIHPKGCDDTESHNSQQGIWQTTEVNVESDSMRDVENDPLPKVGLPQV